MAQKQPTEPKGPRPKLSSTKGIQWVTLDPPIPYGSEFTRYPDSLFKRGLRRPGVLVKMDGEVRLIGDINKLGGVCDCCCDMDSDALIEAYAIVYTPEEKS